MYLGMSAEEIDLLASADLSHVSFSKHKDTVCSLSLFFIFFFTMVCILMVVMGNRVLPLFQIGNYLTPNHFLP